jgi:acetyl esterase/lipase
MTGRTSRISLRSRISRALAGAALLVALPEAAGAQTKRFVSPDDVKAMPARAATARVAYGADSLQFGELRVPDGPGPFPVAVVVHGGCWLSTYFTLGITAPLADALRDAGIATWNVEYRTVDRPGGGWPGTFRDVAAAVDHVRVLAREHPLDTTRVVAVGHSAGGPLALWAAGRGRVPAGSELADGALPLGLRGAVSLGGPPDLRAFATRDAFLCGGTAVTERLLGGSWTAVQARWLAASPAELLPLGVPQRLIVGTRDPVVPAEHARAYEARALAAGDDVRYVPLEGVGHFEVIAPGHASAAGIRAAVLELLGPPSVPR